VRRTVPGRGVPAAAPLPSLFGAARRAWLPLLACLALSAGCAKERPTPLVIIGLDGATWDLLEPWMAAGDLPNLKAFRDGANWGTMQSVVPYLSPPAWTSAVTGVNPGRHGIYDFQRRLPGDGVSLAATPQGRPIVTETSKSRRSPPIWNLLKGSGRRVAIINIPMTDPPDEVDGIMIAGFPHLDQEGYAWPRELEARCRQAGYLLDEMEMALPPGREEEILATYTKARDTRWALAKQLYQEEEYDFFWIVFTGVDRIQHLYWIFDDPRNEEFDPRLAERFSGTMRRFWMEQDRILGEFFALIRPSSTVLLVSDHGFGPIRRELRAGTWARTAASGFSTTEAAQIFSLDRSDAARLYVREPGRDPGADLSREQAGALRDRLATGLRGVIDPETGEAPVEALYRSEEVYVGKYAEKGPDLTMIPSQGYFVSWGDVANDYRQPPFGPVTSTISGWHRMDGVYAVRGPEIVPGKSERVYNLLDLAPTSLYLLGHPLPEDFDGKIMDGIFAPDRLRKRPPVFRGVLSEEDRPLTPEEQRALKNLPYVGG